MPIVDVRPFASLPVSLLLLLLLRAVAAARGKEQEEKSLDEGAAGAPAEPEKERLTHPQR